MAGFLFRLECLLRQRLRRFLEAGADPGGALLLAAQIEVGTLRLGGSVCRVALQSIMRGRALERR
jgi:hypothetical protein